MPNKRVYKKRNSKKSRKPAYFRHGMNALTLASKSLAVAYGVKKMLNVEYKFHDVQLTDTGISTTPTITQITNIPQGDTDITRDGAQVKLTRLILRYVVSGNTSALITHFRIIVVRDKQTNGAIYTASDLLQDVTASDAIVSPLNLDNKFRFQVLYNKVHTIVVGAVTDAIYKEFVKELDLRLRFESSTPSIADLNSNSLSIFMVSNQATNTPTITLFSRIRYVDN